MKTLIILLFAQCFSCISISQLNLENEIIKVLCKNNIIEKEIDSISFCFVDSLLFNQYKISDNICNKVILKSCEIDHSGIIVNIKNIYRVPPNDIVVKYHTRHQFPGFQNYGTIIFEENNDKLIFIKINNISAID